MAGSTPVYDIPYYDRNDDPPDLKITQQMADKIEAALLAGSDANTPVHGLYALGADQTNLNSAKVVTGFTKVAGWSHPDIDDYVTLSSENLWTVNIVGRYRVVMRERWDIRSDGHRHLYVVFNGADADQVSQGPGSSADIVVRWEAEAMPLVVGNTFQMKAFQTSGLNTLALKGDGSHIETYVFFEYLGPNPT